MEEEAGGRASGKAGNGGADGARTPNPRQHNRELDQTCAKEQAAFEEMSEKIKQWKGMGHEWDRLSSRARGRDYKYRIFWGGQ